MPPGDSVTFTCTFPGKNYINNEIVWAVDDSTETSTLCSKNCVTTNFNDAMTTSTLTIDGNRSLDIGQHDVECTVTQNLESDFKEDRSFRSGDDKISSSATLTIEHQGITITVHSKSISTNAYCI